MDRVMFIFTFYDKNDALIGGATSYSGQVSVPPNTDMVSVTIKNTSEGALNASDVPSSSRIS